MSLLTTEPSLLASIFAVFEPVRDAIDPWRRRVTSAGERLHLELRIPPAAGFLAFAAQLQGRLEGMRGIERVHINAPLCRVVVQLRSDAAPREDIEAVIREVEAAHGIGEQGFLRDGPDHPGDAAPLARVALEIGADGAAFVTALLGRLLGLGVLPFEIDLLALLSVVRGTPRLRELADRALGGQTAELLLGLAGAAAQGLAQRPLGPLIDVAYRTLVGAELLARRSSWLLREPDLFAAVPRTALALEPTSRPAPLPAGPIESFAEKAIYGTLGAFGIGLTGTGSLAAAAAPLVGGTPRPAHVGRQAFSAWLGRSLAARGIVVLDPTSLRRLDRVDTVVVDGRLIVTGCSELGTIVPLGAEPLGDLGERAAALFDPSAPLDARSADGWRLAPLDPEEAEEAMAGVGPEVMGVGPVLGLSRACRLVALVAVRPSADPDLAGLIAAARRNALDLRVAATDSRAQVLVPADRLLSSDVPGLIEALRTLQRAGKVVCFVGCGTAEALAAADVAIGLQRSVEDVPWCADILCGASLDDARVVLEACGPARTASQQSVYIAESGIAAASLLALGGLRWTTTAQVASVVDVASLVALVNGIRLGSVAATPPPVARRAHFPWHALEVERVLAHLSSSEAGLPSAEAERRRRVAPPEPTVLARFTTAAAAELASPLTPFLGIAAALSAAVGSTTDAVMVAGVAAFDAVVGAVQRVQTEGAVTELGRSKRRAVRVLRDAVETTCDADELVPGDVIRLEAGDVVPADCRVLHAHMLEADESSLTGESLPVAKGTQPSIAINLAERTSMLYAGTSIAAGRARAVVVATGDATEAEQARDVGEGAAPPSGVELRLREILDVSTPIAVGSAIAVAASGLVRGRPLQEVISSGVGLAVAAVPESLAMVATMAQLASAGRLSDRGALVQNVRAIEALGRIDVLCVDKTGTLTEGRIALSSVSDGERSEQVTALGTAGRAILAAAVRATPVRTRGRILPHPTDEALLGGAEAMGVSASGAPDAPVRDRGATLAAVPTYGGEGVVIAAGTAADEWLPLAELPFEPARAYHAVLGRLGDTVRLSVKGAPEVVLPRCAGWLRDGSVEVLDDDARERLAVQARSLARRGLRVLAVAERTLAVNGGLGDEHVVDLLLHGFVGFSDNVRPTARDSVQTLRRAGVGVVMMTGDHPSTAERIASELGLLDRNGVLTGAEIDRLDDDELDARLPGVSVIARLTPSHKVRLVRAYQRLGHVVGMTGDGANDAPAIRLSHVGIALGARATTAARNAADVVITDDRIETLVDAVIEGRAMWASVRDAISVLVGGNLGEVLFIVTSALLGGSSPLNARQLLLVNLLTDAAPAIGIALRPPPATTPEQLLREGPEASLGRVLERDIVVRGVLTAGATAAAWLGARFTGRASRASTVAFATLVMSQLGQTLVAGGRSPIVIATTLASFGLTAGIIQTPILSQIFGCTPIGPFGWGMALTASAATSGIALVLPPLLEHFGPALKP